MSLAHPTVLDILIYIASYLAFHSLALNNNVSIITVDKFPNPSDTSGYELPVFSIIFHQQKNYHCLWV